MDKTTDSKVPPVKMPISGIKLALASGLIAIAALLLGMSMLLRLNHMSVNFVKTQVEMSQNFDKIDQQLTQQQQTLAKLNSTSDNLIVTQQEFAQQLKHSNDVINALSLQHLDVNDVMWQLKQAYHFMQLAQFNLHWNHDVASSIFLLQHADQLMQQLGLPDTLNIRQSIANEITQLSAIPTIDKPGIMSQLSAINQQIPQLPLFVNQYSTPQASTVTKPLTGWRYAWQQTWKNLQNIMIIRQHNQDIKPLLSSQQRRLLDDRIMLLLQQAQWALLQPDNTIYQLSLKQAIRGIKDNFILDSADTRAVLQQLKELVQKSIAPTLPALTGSQFLLKQYLEEYSQKTAAHNAAHGT